MIIMKQILLTFLFFIISQSVFASDNLIINDEWTKWFDANNLIPVMIGLFVILGGVGGGLFYKEYDTLTQSRWIFYLIGLTLIIAGLSLNIIANSMKPNNQQKTSYFSNI